MTELNDEEIQKVAEALAPLLIKDVKALHHDFWIDPETHYQAHIRQKQFENIFTPDIVLALGELVSSYKSGRKFFWKIFLSLIVVGAMTLAFQGWLMERFK